MRKLTTDDIAQLAERCANQLADVYPDPAPPVQLVGIPRGGVVAAYAVAEALPRARPDLRGYVHSTADYHVPADSRSYIPPVVVDDVLMTGNTLRRDAARLDARTAVVLVDKRPQGALLSLLSRCQLVSGLQLPADDAPWVQFPWEVNDPDQGLPEDAVRRLIEHAGDDPAREGLVDTPRRVLAYLTELREAGAETFAATTFESQSDDVLVVTGIPLASLCEHHMLPYTGTAAVGYIPNGKILGLSKIARVVQKVASGLTVQEDLTRRVAELVIEASGSPDVAVVTQASHSCMTIRGVRAVGSETLASAMLGRFREEQSLRSEALALLTRR